MMTNVYTQPVIVAESHEDEPPHWDGIRDQIVDLLDLYSPQVLHTEADLYTPPTCQIYRGDLPQEVMVQVWGGQTRKSLHLPKREHLRSVWVHGRRMDTPVEIYAEPSDPFTSDGRTYVAVALETE